MELTELLEGLRKARERQPKRAVHPRIDNPITISAELFQALVDRNLQQWAYINNVGDNIGSHYNKCGYDGAYYAAKTQHRLHCNSFRRRESERAHATKI